MTKIGSVGLVGGGILWVLVALAAGCGTYSGLGTRELPPPPAGLASGFPGDRGIGSHPEVILADDFESWTDEGTRPPPGTWEVLRGRSGHARVIPAVTHPPGGVGAAGHVLEIACWKNGEATQVAGLAFKLGDYDHPGEGRGPGYEEVFLRFYARFDEDYRVVSNHGINLGGRDVARPDAGWVGQAGIHDPSELGYFFSGLQPYGIDGDRRLEWGFYSYHLDKPDQWGHEYWPQRAITIRVGTWHCVERRMRLNSVDPARRDPALADGVEELWVDGVPSIRRTDLRFRRVPHLRITRLNLETFYFGLPARYDRAHPIKIHIDHVVLARRYIGPLRL